MSTSLFQIIPPSWVSCFEKSLILNLHFPIFLYVVRVCQSQPTSTGSPNYGMDTVIMERVTFFIYGGHITLQVVVVELCETFSFLL